jgi:hypothetical protein
MCRTCGLLSASAHKHTHVRPPPPHTHLFVHGTQLAEGHSLASTLRRLAKMAGEALAMDQGTTASMLHLGSDTALRRRRESLFPVGGPGKAVGVGAIPGPVVQWSRCAVGVWLSRGWRGLRG